MNKKDKKDFMNMSAGICMIMGFVSLMIIFLDFVSNNYQCNNLYGWGLLMTSVLFGASAILYFLNQERYNIK